MRLPFPSFVRFTAWLALLAALLQFAAVPLANAHMLQRALAAGNAQLVEICTPLGSKQLLIGDDGQPVHTQVSKWANCAVCFVGGAAPLLISGPKPLPATGLLRLASVLPASVPVLSGAGEFWPFGHGPPPASALL